MDHATPQPRTVHPTSVEDVCRTPLSQLVSWPSSVTEPTLRRVLGDGREGRRTEVMPFQSAV